MNNETKGSNSVKNENKPVLVEWAVGVNFEKFKRAYRINNKDVKVKEVVYADGLKTVAIAIDMLNSNINPLQETSSDFKVNERFYARKEYLELIPSNIMKLIAPRAVTIDGEDETKGRLNLRIALSRTSTENVTPLQLKVALQELARYAGKTYSVGGEATDGKDVTTVANINIAGGDRCIGSDTLPVDIQNAQVFVKDKAYVNWVDTTIQEVLDSAVVFN